MAKRKPVKSATVGVPTVVFTSKAPLPDLTFRLTLAPARRSKRPLAYDPVTSKKYSKGTKLKQCFSNCQRLLIDQRMPEGTLYVEGYIGPLGVHHAWLELGDSIIDPTRIKLDALHSTDDWSYHPKVRVTPHMLCGALVANHVTLWDLLMGYAVSVSEKVVSDQSAYLKGLRDRALALYPTSVIRKWRAEHRKLNNVADDGKQ